MKQNKYLFLIYIFLCFGFSSEKKDWEEFSKAIRDSLHKRRSETLPPHQKCCKYLLQKLISKDNSIDANSNYGIIHDEEALECNLISNTNILTNEENEIVKRTVEDTDANRDSEDYAQCVGCYDLYDKNILFKYEHINKQEEPHFHYSTCYECEQRFGDLHDATKCAYCRKPSAKKFPAFFIDRNLVITRFYDDSCIAQAISSISMWALSSYLLSIDNENTTMVDIKNFNRNTWLFLSIISSVFVYHGRKSVSILFDYRGLAFLLFPILNGIIAKYDLDMASYLSMSTLLSIFGQLLSTKKNFIISDRFYQFMSFFPERVLCMQNGERFFRLQQFQGKARIKEFFFNLVFYMILWATIAVRQTHDKICQITEISGENLGELSDTSPWYTNLCDTIHSIMVTETGFIAFASIAMGLLFLFKIIIHLVLQKSVFNYNQGLWILVVGLIVNLSITIKDSFILGNMILMLTIFTFYMIISAMVIIAFCYLLHRIFSDKLNLSLAEYDPNAYNFCHLYDHHCYIDPVLFLIMVPRLSGLFVNDEELDIIAVIYTNKKCDKKSVYKKRLFLL